MIDATEIRRQVRAVLSTQPADAPMSEGYLLAGLRRFFPESVSAAEMATALQWNEARGWAEKRWNADEEKFEWLLNHRGRVKEGVA